MKAKATQPPNGKQKTGPVTRKFRELNRAERLQAHAVCVQLLSQLRPDRDIKAVIRTQYGCSISAANSLLNSAIRTIRSANRVHAEEKRQELEAAYRALYVRGWDTGKLQVCVQALKQMAELLGIEAPQQVEFRQMVPERFGDGRSEDDLKFYAANGFWPEESGAPAPPTKADPLAALPLPSPERIH